MESSNGAHTEGVHCEECTNSHTNIQIVVVVVQIHIYQ